MILRSVSEGRWKIESPRIGPERFVSDKEGVLEANADLIEDTHAGGGSPLHIQLAQLIGSFLRVSGCNEGTHLGYSCLIDTTALSKTQLRLQLLRQPLLFHLLQHGTKI